MSDLKHSLMLIDDTPDNLRLLERILGNDTHQLRCLTGGKAALRSARHSPPDLILLDIRMPEQDGFAVCTELKADPALRDIPVIFISAMNETSEKVKAFEAGGVDYITKPFQELEVLARVRAHLELRRQKVQLEKNFTQLKKMEDMRDNLVHMVVHDLRNPLMAVQGYLQLATTFECENISDEGRGYLSEAGRAVERCMSMAEEMLMVSKLESRGLQLNLEPVNLTELAAEAIKDMKSQQESKSIQLQVQTRHCMVAGDRRLLARVIHNLLSNALKFSPQEGRVEVNIAEQQQRLTLAVKDQGPGIPPEYHQTIFEKFGQAPSQFKRKGFGLGLTFCKLAVEAHGGRMYLQSTPQQGSTFAFDLDLPVTS